MTTTTMPVELTPTRAASSRAERMLVPAAFITNLGNSVQLTAASVLVFSTEGTTLAVGWLFIAVAIPQMLLSLFFGRLADRFDRRTLCIIADLASVLAAVALPVWLLLGGPDNLAVYIVSFALAIVGALFMPASNALIKERIAANRLGAFNANFEIAVQAGTLLSAAAGGFMIQIFGVQPLFFFNAVTFIASAACLFAMGRRPAVPAGSAESDSDRAAAALAHNPPLVRLGLLYALGNIVIMVGNAMLLVLIIQGFHSGVGILGLADALFGIGVIVAAAAYKRASVRVTKLRIAFVGYLGFAVVLALETIHVAALLVFIPLAGLTFGLARISARTMLMSAAPERRVGWVFGATNAFGLTAGALATVVISLLMDNTEARNGFYALSLLVAVVASITIAGLRLSIARWSEPASA